MTIYELAVIGKALTSWVNTVMVILVIIGAIWLLELVLYKTCVDLLGLWGQFKKVKRMRDWAIIEDSEE
jgi:hypothetical protein